LFYEWALRLFAAAGFSRGPFPTTAQIQKRWKKVGTLSGILSKTDSKKKWPVQLIKEFAENNNKDLS
jgi:hypothetical protein